MTVRVSLTMIVKNEASTLGRCLASVREIVDEIIVVDTGSSDNTKEIAQEHGARVFGIPWQDNFAAARNESLRYANGQWLLWLDGDEFFDDANREKLRSLILELPEAHSFYVMQQRSLAANGMVTLVDQVRFFRNHPDVRWEYRVYEQILPSIRKTGYQEYRTNIAIDHSGYVDNALVRRKHERNLRLADIELAERPDDPYTLYKLGSFLAALGRYGEAIPQLQRSLQTSGNSDSFMASLHATLIRCHLHLGLHSEAWAVCHAGNARFPDDVEMLFLKGILCYQRGDRALARACWTQLLETGCPTAATPITDGSCSLYIAALPIDCDFRNLNANFNWPLVRYHMAVLEREEGQLADAEMNWQAALARAPSFLPARIGLAEIYAQQARWAELEPLICDLEAQAPLDASVLRARLELSRKEFAAARTLLEGAIAQAPQAVPPRLYLTHVLLQEGNDPAAAEQALRQLLALDPSQGDAWFNLATLLHSQGRVAEAITVCQSSRVYLPNHPDIQLLLGMLLHQAGDLVNAEAALRQLLETEAPLAPATGSELQRQVEPNGQTLQRRVTAQHNLALIYRRQGRLAEAEAQWRSAVAAMPELQAAWVGLGELYLMQGRLAEVESILSRLEDSPQGADTGVLLRARWHWQRREYAAARRLLEGIIARQPTFIEPRRLLSYILLEEDRDRAAAERALHELLAVAPEDTEARHNLAVLHYNQRRIA
jgi:tetratricopeptide (TPR) repeat protein